MSTFKGFDWKELCVPLGVTPDEDDTVTQVAIRAKIHQWTADCRPVPEMVAIVRDFVTALAADSAKHKCASAPLWAGLIQITDDDTFIEYAETLLPYMWT